MKYCLTESPAKEAVADLMLRDKTVESANLTVVGIFRTENSVRQNRGCGFCQFGMRSIGKIVLLLRRNSKESANLPW